LEKFCYSGGGTLTDADAGWALHRLVNQLVSSYFHHLDPEVRQSSDSETACARICLDYFNTVLTILRAQYMKQVQQWRIQGDSVGGGDRPPPIGSYFFQKAAFSVYFLCAFAISEDAADKLSSPPSPFSKYLDLPLKPSE